MWRCCRCGCRPSKIVKNNYIRKFYKRTAPSGRSIATRSFASYGGSYTGSDKHAIDAYNLGLKDTINELEILIEIYDAHGAPNPRAPRSASVPTTTEPVDKSSAAPMNELQHPKHWTLDWLWRHMPVSGWIYILGGLLTLLVIAFTLGKKLGPLL